MQIAIDPDALLLHQQFAAAIGQASAAHAVVLVGGSETVRSGALARWRHEHQHFEPSQRLITAIVDQARGDQAPLQIVLERDGSATPLRRMVRDEGWRGLLAMPIRADQIYGWVLLFWRTQAESSDRAREWLLPIAQILGVSMAHAERYQRVEQERSSYRQVFEATTTAMIGIDLQRQVIWMANSAAGTLLARGVADLVDQPIADLFHFRADERATIATGSVGSEILATYQLPEKLPLTLAIELGGFLPNQPTLRVASLRNLSNEWRPIQRLMLAERLAGMNRLTAMIAHQINNPLQAIANSLQVLTRPLEAEKRERYLRMAQVEVERLSGIVRRALDIYQAPSIGRRAVAIQPLIASVLSQLAEQAIQARVQIIHAEPYPAVVVVGFANQLREALLSLGRNAIEAMPEGGTLTIRAFSALEVSGNSDHVVVIEVSDTGVGIPEEELERIFEPFASSKNDATGMGLAICYSIIEQHAGRFAVSSSAEGTTFRVTLPSASSGE
jgi:two-component system NtrC family sensor kinase